MTIVGIILAFTAALAAYLCALAVVVVVCDSTLKTSQKTGQCLVSLLLPVVGPLTVLFMAHDVTPSLIRWVPWPLRDLVRDKAIKRYSSLEEQGPESDAT